MPKEQKGKLYNDLSKIRVDLRILSGHITDILPDARRKNEEIFNFLRYLQGAADQDEMNVKYFQEEVK